MGAMVSIPRIANGVELALRLCIYLLDTYLEGIASNFSWNKKSPYAAIRAQGEAGS
jgi:hypothetical protein